MYGRMYFEYQTLIKYKHDKCSFSGLKIPILGPIFFDLNGKAERWVNRAV
jgi:hypothetical protein